MANLVALGHWLRIPSHSRRLLVQGVLPCAGPVQAMISDMPYADLIRYYHIPALVSPVISKLDFNLLWATMKNPLDKAKYKICFVSNVQNMCPPVQILPQSDSKIRLVFRRLLGVGMD